MTAPQIVAVTSAIQGLSITYSTQTMTILALGSTPDEIDLRTCPVMFIDPENEITDFVSTRTGMGPATGDVHGYSYTINYFVAIEPAGAGRGISDIIPSLFGWASAIVDAIETHDDGLTAEEINASVDVVGTITDPTGRVFHGLRIAVSVEEY